MAWAESHYGWRIDPQWIVWLPGLVSGIHLACQTLTQVGDEVLTVVPVYPPFLAAPARDRSALQDGAAGPGQFPVDTGSRRAPRGHHGTDEAAAILPPSQPRGQDVRREELAAVADMCQRHGVVVCSDEIHCDLLLEPDPHVPFASLSPEIAARTVTLMSPSKTFNLSGLGCGYAVIPDRTLRQQFQTAAGEMVPQPNVLGYAACQAAYEEGEVWRVELIDYLRGNRELLESYFSQKLPQFGLAHVEATYLAWIDARWLGAHNAMTFFDSAGVHLSAGGPFQGEGFVRLNFGCPRPTLREALDRIVIAVNALE